MSAFIVNIFEDIFGDIKKHNEDSSQIAFNCPVCDEGKNKGNLEINYEKNVFNCWVCGDTMQGKVPYLINKFGTKKNLRDYLLLKPDSDTTTEREHKEVIVTLPEGYKKLSETTKKDYKADLALKYLYDRGVTDEIIKEYNIGYTISGDFFNRIIIPSYDIDGKLNYFIARWFSTTYTKLKYLNPTAEKQEIVFNENKINWDATIHICEGVFDHIVIPNSIPLLGKVLSDKLLDLIYDNATCNIIILLDGDAKLSAIELYKRLNFGDLYGRIRICVPPIDFDASLIFERLGNNGVIKLLRGSRKLTQEELDE